jgi:protoheme IX farnesyltransferase
MKQLSEIILDPSEQGIATAMDYFILLKPRVMSLVIFTAFIGAYLAPGHMHPYLFFVSILSIAVGAGASGAFNMWYDRDIDALMTRTRNRPIPAGRLCPNNALTLAVMLSAGSVMTLTFASNFVAGSLLAFTIMFYSLIYTVLLKRRTPQNIVIGGAAGAFPPMIGWAAVTGTISIESIILFAIIFFWTPPHFWALALYKSHEYAKAKIPMLPVVAGIEETKTQILLYTGALAATTLLPYIYGMSGLFYLITAVILSTLFIVFSWQVRKSVEVIFARRLFLFSILYLFLIYSALFIDKIVSTVS